MGLHICRSALTVAVMQTDSTPAARPRLTLNRPKLDELRRASGIPSDAELARRLGVNVVTLYRVSEGKTKPSNEFIASLMVAFPMCSLDDLLVLERAA